MVSTEFSIASGSVMGFDHLKGGRNNQDGVCVLSDGDSLIGIVCDGCSEGKYSEVGARLGARLIAEAIKRNIRHLTERPNPTSPSDRTLLTLLLERARQDVTAQLRVLANAMGGSLSRTVTDYFLFTVIGVLLTERTGAVFSIGDGLVVLNGEVIQIGPFPGNEPPYLAYAITGSSLTDKEPGLLEFKLQGVLPTHEINSVLIGSDGLDYMMKKADQDMPGKAEPVGPISQFWKDERYFRNADMVRRKLALLNREQVKIDWEEKRTIRQIGLLPDDTTLVVIARTLKEGER
jgi:hypothetical protein